MLSRFLSSSCNIANCDSCNSSNTALCSSCIIGYELIDSGVSCRRLDTIETLSTLLITTTTIGICLIAFTTMLKLTSPYIVFLSISQIQMIIALTMVGGFNSEQLVYFVNRLSVFTALFSFAPWAEPNSNGDCNTVTSLGLCPLLNYTPPQSRFKYARLYSGSTLINMSGLLQIVLVILIIHLIIEFCKAIASRCTTNEPTLRIFRKLHYFFTFNIYLRALSVGSTFICISLCTEILYIGETKTDRQTVSFVLSIILLILLYDIWPSLCIFILFLNNVDLVYIDQKYYDLYNEIVDDDELSRLYQFFFLVRKICVGMIVAAIKIFKTESCLVLFLFLSCGHLIFLWMTKPFKRTRDIRLDYCLEFFVIFYTVFLLCLTSPTLWTKSISTALVSIIFALIIILSFIMIGDGIRVLSSYIYSKIKKTKPKQVGPDSEIKPIENILNHITRITTLQLEDRREDRRADQYEESKIEVTLEDISRFKKKGRTFQF